MVIMGSSIFLKLLSVEDVTEAYRSWMNDREVTRYLESRWKSYSMDDLRSFVKDVNNGKNNFFFGIYAKKTETHIGNIKLGDIDQLHRYGDIGLLIGDKEYWGKGVATEAIRLVVRFAFIDLNLNKVTAGMYENNLGSLKAFLKNGFNECGRFKKHVFCDGAYMDVLKVELLREDF